VIAHETGITAEPDPFGGSEYVERLTRDIEAAAMDYIRRIDEMGGMIAAIERGFPQSEIAQASYAFQRSVESGESVIVGVNRFQQAEDAPIDILKISAVAEQRQREGLANVKRSRDSRHLEQVLQKLKRAAEGSENTMPYLLDAVRAYATVGEMCAVLKEVFGAYTETAAF
jgi:methylmalonyl-CoA mutase N-terminal domain/subunit